MGVFIPLLLIDRLILILLLVPLILIVGLIVYIHSITFPSYMVLGTPLPVNYILSNFILGPIDDPRINIF